MMSSVDVMFLYQKTVERQQILLRLVFDSYMCGSVVLINDCEVYVMCAGSCKRNRNFCALRERGCWFQYDVTPSRFGLQQDF
jgi:hypothetical protein